MRDDYRNYEAVDYTRRFAYTDKVSELRLVAPLKQPIGFKCPRCQHLLPLLDTSSITRCPNCELAMRLITDEVYGPRIFCYAE
ncbi:MAG: hypothetical protein ACXABY_37670 [Candidatus Thorarchaeota archaeon]|jgi:hypothetical protein